MAAAYVLDFPAGGLPQVGAFWSLTLYDKRDCMLVENPLQRYSLGDRSPGLRHEADGGLRLHLSVPCRRRTRHAVATGCRPRPVRSTWCCGCTFPPRPTSTTASPIRPCAAWRWGNERAPDAARPAGARAGAGPAAGRGVPPARAQDYPSRAVRLLSPYGPGGSNDTSARLLAEALSRRYGQQFVVENKRARARAWPMSRSPMQAGWLHAAVGGGAVRHQYRRRPAAAL